MLQGHDSGGGTFRSGRLVGINQGVDQGTDPDTNFTVRADVHKSWLEGDFIRNYKGGGPVDEFGLEEAYLGKSGYDI